jgi:hypothetical protein
VELTRLRPALAKSEEQMSFTIENFNPIQSWDEKTPLGVERHSICITGSGTPQIELPTKVSVEIQNLNPAIFSVQDKYFAIVNSDFRWLLEFGGAVSAAALSQLRENFTGSIQNEHEVTRGVSQINTPGPEVDGYGLRILK